MKYIKEILFAAFICGMIAKLSPEGKNRGLVRFAAAIAFLGVMASPVLGIFGEISSFAEKLRGIEGEAAEEFEAKTENRVAREICAAAVRLASEHFRLAPEKFSLRLIFGTDSGGESFISRCEVWVKAEGVDWKEVQKYFENILGCEVILHGE